MTEEGLGIDFEAGLELGGLGFICNLDARRHLRITFCFCGKNQICNVFVGFSLMFPHSVELFVG